MLLEHPSVGCGSSSPIVVPRSLPRPEQRTPGRPSLECPFTAVNGSQARRLPLRSHVVSSPVGVSDAKLRRPIDERTIRLLDQELIRRVIARFIPAAPPEARAAWRAGWCSRPKDFRLRSLGARSQPGRGAGAPRRSGMGGLGHRGSMHRCCPCASAWAVEGRASPRALWRVVVVLDGHQRGCARRTSAAAFCKPPSPVSQIAP
jgi:hypothetical protein